MKKLAALFAALVTFVGVAFAGINVNSATKEQLETLEGIGPVKAQAIIDYRKKNGPFKSLADLKKVEGIGDATFETIRKDVMLSGRSDPAPKKDEKAAPATKPADKAPPAPAAQTKKAPADAKKAAAEKKAAKDKAAKEKAAKEKAAKEMAAKEAKAAKDTGKSKAADKAKPADAAKPAEPAKPADPAKPK